MIYHHVMRINKLDSLLEINMIAFSHFFFCIYRISVTVKILLKISFAVSGSFEDRLTLELKRVGRSELIFLELSTFSCFTSGSKEVTQDFMI